MGFWKLALLILLSPLLLIAGAFLVMLIGVLLN